MPSDIRHQILRKLKRTRKSIRRIAAYYAWIVDKIPEDHELRYQTAIHAKLMGKVCAELRAMTDETEKLFRGDEENPVPSAEEIDEAAEDILEEWIEQLDAMNPEDIKDWAEGRE